MRSVSEEVRLEKLGRKLALLGWTPVVRDRAVRPAFCSTKYVRDVRPMGPVVGHGVDIANCNVSFILQLKGVGDGVS